MDPESKRLLEDTFVLAKDNHRLLRAIRRHQLLSAFGKVIIWVILILASALSYLVYLQPFIDKYQASGASMFDPGAFGISTTTPLGKLINSLKAGQ